MSYKCISTQHTHSPLSQVVNSCGTRTLLLKDSMNSGIHCSARPCEYLASCMNNQWTTSPLKNRPRCYVKSPTAQDAFWPIPAVLGWLGDGGELSIWIKCLWVAFLLAYVSYSWSRTPLDDAIFHSHDRVAAYLLQKGGRTSVDIQQSCRQWKLFMCLISITVYKIHVASCRINT